jgi:hypothetical protein
MVEPLGWNIFTEYDEIDDDVGVMATCKNGGACCLRLERRGWKQTSLHAAAYVHGGIPARGIEKNVDGGLLVVFDVETRAFQCEEVRGKEKTLI